MDSEQPPIESKSKIVSRRKFLRIASTALTLGAVAATGADKVLLGGAGANYATETFRSKETLISPRLIEPTIVLDASKSQRYDQEMIVSRTNALMKGMQGFFERNANFQMQLHDAKVVILSATDNNIFNIPSNLHELFGEAAQQMAREYTTPQTGTVIGVFAPDFASQGSFGIANTDGRFFALFDTASRAITKKGATYGDLYATARESIHEFSHTLGIMHPQNKEEVTLTSPGSYVGPDYFDPNNPNYRNPESPIVETDITNYVSNLTIGIHPEDLLLINNLYNQK